MKSGISSYIWEFFIFPFIFPVLRNVCTVFCTFLLGCQYFSYRFVGHFYVSKLALSNTSYEYFCLDFHLSFNFRFFFTTHTFNILNTDLNISVFHDFCILFSYLCLPYSKLFTSVVFLPEMHNLNLITRKHWTNPNWGIFCKITHQCSTDVSRSWKEKKKGLSQIGKA